MFQKDTEKIMNCNKLSKILNYQITFLTGWEPNISTRGIQENCGTRINLLKSPRCENEKNKKTNVGYGLQSIYFGISN